MVVRTFIIGSCVSRDILSHQQHDLLLTNYLARSSFASSFHPQCAEDGYSINLASTFKQRMVAADFAKSSLEDIVKFDYDKLLIDLIDERFDLFRFLDGSICTLSNELIESGFNPKDCPGSVIESGSEEFFQLWQQGWTRLLKTLREKSLIDKVIINKVYWAETEEDGSGFSPSYSTKGINAANAFLERLYDRIAQDLDQHQFLRFEPRLFIGSIDHRWGRSPFHYSDSYYAEALEQLLSSQATTEPASLESEAPRLALDFPTSLMATQEIIPEYFSDKSILSWKSFDLKRTSPNSHSLSSCKLTGNCTSEITPNAIRLLFEATHGTHQATFNLKQSINCNGMSIRLRLQKWLSIRYLAFGYTYNGTFRHIKVVNPPQGQWVDIDLRHGGIGFGLQNNWSHPSATEITDLRVYLRAEPHGDGASVEVDHFLVWEEVQTQVADLATCTRPQVLPAQVGVPQDLMEVLFGYLRKCFRHAPRQADSFMTFGQCPLYGEIQLDWLANEALPSTLSTVGTYAFSWHSLHPATILLIHAKDSGLMAPVFAARDIVTSWLDRSYYTPDADKKFAWYDHGTAERQIAFLLMWAKGIELGFDQRFMGRLAEAIISHAQLLETEQFYASHQPTRYHNHAWFQDLALMATALALPDYPAASRWMERAIERLTDQLQVLIVRDNGFSVFVENSIGYHQGVQRIVELAGDMVRLTGRDSSIPDVAVELSRFSDFFRYPDNRAPAQGDTFRRSNLTGDAVRRLKPYPEPEIALLSKAGYGIVKGNHEGVRFMFSMFATSLCRTHKHQDDLSFTLFFDGVEWLIDPSFFSHEYLSPIPAYLRSSAAHNTIHLPDLSYSIDPGKSVLTGSVTGTDFCFSGYHIAHEGYRVSRSVDGSAVELNLSFCDEITPEQNTLCEAYLMLQCGEGVKVSREESHAVLSHPDSRFELQIAMPAEAWSVDSGVLDGPQVRGVSGTAFMQSADIETIQCPIAMGSQHRWTIQARLKS